MTTNCSHAPNQYSQKHELMIMLVSEELIDTNNRKHEALRIWKYCRPLHNTGLNCADSCICAFCSINTCVVLICSWESADAWGQLCALTYDIYTGSLSILRF